MPFARDVLKSGWDTDIRIVDDLEPPECGEGQVRIAPAYVGICGTGMYKVK